MKKSLIILIISIIIFLVVPSHYGLILLHEFGHYIIATIIGADIIELNLKFKYGINSNILIKGDGVSPLIILGGLLSLIFPIIVLWFLFKVKDNFVYFIIFLFYFYLVFSSFLLMEGDFKMLNLLWLNQLLSVVIIILGLIPFFIKLYKGEVRFMSKLFKHYF